MQYSLEQRSAIKFSVKLEKTATENFEMTKRTYQKECLARNGVFWLQKAFLKGQKDFTDEARAGRPSTSSRNDNVRRVWELLNTGRGMNVHLQAQAIGIQKSIDHDIVTNDLQTQKHCRRLEVILRQRPS